LERPNRHKSCPVDVQTTAETQRETVLTNEVLVECASLSIQSRVGDTHQDIAKGGSLVSLKSELRAEKRLCCLQMNLGERRRRGRCSSPELETDVSKQPDISVWIKTEVQIESVVIPVAGAE